MPTGVANKLIYYRIIALWVLCEAMLGGIIHGFKIPVSGLVVGSCAVICICLLAWYVPKKGAIIKATIIVAVFKMMLSPQAPAPAYIAVFFQGLLGELLFWNRRFYTISCVLLAVLSLLESGLQRILVLTIVYGNDIWKVINNFFNSLTRQKGDTNYSLWIGGVYVAIHLITGMAVGWLASRLPYKVRSWSSSGLYRLPSQPANAIELPALQRKNKGIKTWLFVIWIALIALYIQSYFNLGRPILPSHISFKIFIRSLIIILAWFFIAGPLLKSWLYKWLQKQQAASQTDIQQVLSLLPGTRELVIQSWGASASKKGWRRLRHFTRTLLSNSLADSACAGKVYLFTGPIQSGKTTALREWVNTKTDVHGILTPLINGKRVFHDIKTGEQFPMESMGGDEDVLTVGRFTFSRKSFDRASRIIREAINKPGWLVVDEIGPLELTGAGFSDVLKDIIIQRHDKVLLVVRDKDNMPDRVKEYFNLPNAVVTPSITGLE
ncbi:MAG TPA: nucleoside-triphosphatase [Chitinophagaceae bacterium]